MYIRVTYNRVQKWFSTGIKLYKDEWSESIHAINNMNMGEYNETIDSIVSDIQKYINKCISEKVEFSFEGLKSYIGISKNGNETFLQFMDRRIDEHKNFEINTIKRHRTTYNGLKEFGCIITFEDITKANIAKFDEWLHSKYTNQVTIYGYHKFLRRYINEAIMLGYIESNPYKYFKFDHGKSAGIRYLIKSEIDKIEQADMKSPHIERARDLFIFQCYTGLSYCDLAKFDWNNAKKNGENYVIRDVRKKTDEEYYLLLLKPALRILKKYKFKLPIITNQKYNDYLKTVGDYSGIDKVLYSHMARHSFAVMMASNGVPFSILAKMMGHANSRITESVYAKILAEDVKGEYDRINKILK